MQRENLNRRRFIQLSSAFAGATMLSWPSFAGDSFSEIDSNAKPFKLSKPRWEIFDDGRFDLVTDTIIIRGCRPSIDGQVIMPKNVFLGDSPKGKRIVYELNDGFLMLDLKVNKNSVSISTELSGFSQAPHWFYPVSHGIVENTESFFKQGLGSGGPSGIVSLNNVENSKTKNISWSHDSYMVTGLLNNKQTLACGSLKNSDFLNRTTIYNRSHNKGLIDRFRGDEKIYIESGFSMEKIFFQNEYIKLPDIHFFYGNNPFYTLNHFAWEVAKQSESRQGMLSCYHWCLNNNKKENCSFSTLKSQIDTIRKKEDPIPVQSIQINEGYCLSGDWLKPNKKWPGGLDRAAREIFQYGYKAGIWIAPFMVHNKSDIYRQHKNWLVKDFNNDPIPESDYKDGKYYALDGSHPNVQKYIRRVFKTLRRIGFTFYKIDYLEWGFKNSLSIKRAVPGKTSVQVLREVCSIIREEIGAGSFWLAGNSPFSPMIGFADGMQVANCINTEHGQNGSNFIVNESFNGQYFNNVFWQNDTEIISFKNDKPQADYKEKSIAFWNGILGGIINTSDNLMLWDKTNEDLFRFLEPQERPSNAELPFWPDPEEIKIAVRKYPKQNSWGVLFFNEKNKPVNQRFKLKSLTGQDQLHTYIWDAGTQLYIGKEKNIEVKLKPYQSMLLYLAKNTTPPPENLTIGGKRTGNKIK